MYVDILSLGLGYTVVVTSDGGIGIAFIYFKDKKSCMLLNEAIDYENRPASALLEKIKSKSAYVLRAIWHGMGTPVLHKFSRKSYLSLILAILATISLDKIYPNVAMVKHSAFVSVKMDPA